MEKHLGLTTYLKVEYRFFLWSLVLTDLFFYFINLNNFLVGQNWSHRWVPHIIRDFLLTCEQNLMLNFLPYSIFVNCTSVRLSCQPYYLDFDFSSVFLLVMPLCVGKSPMAQAINFYSFIFLIISFLNLKNRFFYRFIDTYKLTAGVACYPFLFQS
jgi:hypothetical protein